jgi:hypothetical protein
MGLRKKWKRDKIMMAVHVCEKIVKNEEIPMVVLTSL